MGLRSPSMQLQALHFTLCNVVAECKLWMFYIICTISNLPFFPTSMHIDNCAWCILVVCRVLANAFSLPWMFCSRNNVPCVFVRAVVWLEVEWHPRKKVHKPPCKNYSPSPFSRTSSRFRVQVRHDIPMRWCKQSCCSVHAYVWWQIVHCCGGACAMDYNQLCPSEWIENSSHECVAPWEYDGPCVRKQKFAEMSPMEKHVWGACNHLSICPLLPLWLT